jgi:hypothetical protein
MSGSLTGGMGGDYTSWRRAIKANRRNSPEPHLELQHCRGWLRESSEFAGRLSATSSLCNGTATAALVRAERP